MYYFSVRSGSGQKMTGHYGVGAAKNLAPQDSNVLYFTRRVYIIFYYILRYIFHRYGFLTIRSGAAFTFNEGVSL